MWNSNLSKYLRFWNGVRYYSQYTIIYDDFVSQQEVKLRDILWVLKYGDAGVQWARASLKRRLFIRLHISKYGDNQRR